MQIIIISILVIIIAYLIYSQYEGFANMRRNSNRSSHISSQNRGIYVDLKRTPQRKASDIPLHRPDRPNKPHNHHKPNNSWDYHGGYNNYIYDYPLSWYDYVLPWNWNYLFYPSLYDPYFTPAFDYADNCHEKCADRYSHINNDFEYNAKVVSCINENCY